VTVAFRHETLILGRSVVIRATQSGRYEVSMQGRGGFETDPRTLPDLVEAKAEAHAFVHRTLQRPCICDEIQWTVAHELPVGFSNPAKPHHAIPLRQLEQQSA